MKRSARSGPETPSFCPGRVWVGALLLLATLTAPVRATTFAALSLEQQAKKADVIVQATIGAPTTVTEAGRTYNVYPLKVSETLAGDAAMLPQIGGTQGGGSPALYVLSGMERGPSFQSGQEAVLLLYKGRFDSPLVGFNQGAYLVSGGLVSVLFAPDGDPATLNAASQSPSPQLVYTPPPVTPLPATVPPTALPPVTATLPASGATGTEPAPPPLPTAATTGTTAQSGTVPIPATQNSATQNSATQNPATQNTAVQIPAAQTQVVQPLPTLAPNLSASTAGVLGKIRTPAELKAAIVAARAAR